MSASLRSPLASPSKPASSCSTPVPRHPRPPAKGKVRLRAPWHLSAPEPGPRGSGHMSHCPRGLPGSWLRLGLGDTVGGPPGNRGPEEATWKSACACLPGSRRQQFQTESLSFLGQGAGGGLGSPGCPLSQAGDFRRSNSGFKASRTSLPMSAQRVPTCLPRLLQAVPSTGWLPPRPGRELVLVLLPGVPSALSRSDENLPPSNPAQETAVSRSCGPLA